MYYFYGGYFIVVGKKRDVVWRVIVARADFEYKWEREEFVQEWQESVARGNSKAAILE